jgi:Type I phosphodiesterase / nucleotide pyrophosphatase
VKVAVDVAEHMPKILLVVIDAASPRVIAPAIQTGHLPIMQRLVQAGTLHDSSTTIFPSITPAATASIIVGGYPAESGIVGASWYDEEHNEIAYYGDDFWVAAREGFRAFLRDFLVRLNGDRLKARTLLERVELAGRRAASINYLVFKGICTHKVRIPGLLELLPGAPVSALVNGPSIFTLGDFASTRTPRGKRLDTNKEGLLHRFGMDDAASGELLAELMEDGLPDFTVAYFADNDYRSHAVGPYSALGAVERVDAMLGRAFDAAGGLDRVLEDTYVIVTSDHGQVEVLSDDQRAAIRLHETLAGFRQARLGGLWRDTDQIMICPNMRAAQIYLRDVQPSLVQQITTLVLSDPRVDQVIWRTGDTRAAGGGYTVVSTAGQLEFVKGENGSSRARDAFGQVWSWRGDLSVVDASVDEGELRWRSYPNAFERLAGVLEHPHSGTIWVTAKPGCEFEVPGSSAHLGGGSHGGLHALESLSPVIAAGPRRLTLPDALRSVDIVPLCLELLELDSPHRMSEPR